MGTERRKNVSFSTLVKIFLRDYNIPTKKDVDRISVRIERLENLIQSMIESQKKPPFIDEQRPGPANASEIVTAIIRNSPGGIPFAEIQTQTGFDEKKLRNILYRLHSLKKIHRRSRGIYGPA